MIISISGKMYHGKDTVGKILQCITAGYDKNMILKALVQPEYKPPVETAWEIRKFAEPLRKVASILLNLPEDYLYTDAFKKSYLPPQWDVVRQTVENDEHSNDVYRALPMTGREFLQKLGTDAIRNGLHENAWLNGFISQYTPSSKWFITDTRYPNEYYAVKKKDGIVIRVIRPSAVSNTVNEHISETSLDNMPFDYVIINDGSLEDLIEKTLLIALKLNFHGNDTTDRT